MAGGWRRSIVLPLILAAAAYVALGYWIDLPPYGIWPDAVSYKLRLQPGQVSTDVHLTYVCTSWRHRRTTVYLPFTGAPGQAAVENLEGQVTGGSWERRPDGVLLFLSIPPKGKATAHFRYTQLCSDRTFRFDFPVVRGWDEVPPVTGSVVTVPTDLAPRFSVPVVRRKSDGQRTVFEVDGRADRPLKVVW